jgi:hypothetical protein
MGREKCITLSRFTNDEMDHNYTPLGPASPDGVDWTLDIPDSDHVRFFRSIQWHSTLLGPIQSWKTALRLYVYQVFADNRPSCLYWCVQITFVKKVITQSNVIARGPDKVAIYNEGFAGASEGAHPFLMGHTFRETVSRL